MKRVTRTLEGVEEALQLFSSANRYPPVQAIIYRRLRLVRCRFLVWTSENETLWPHPLRTLGREFVSHGDAKETKRPF